MQLPSGFHQALSLAEQDPAAFDDDRKLRQRSLDTGNIASKFIQATLDIPGRRSSRKQLGQPPGRRNFLEIKVGKTVDLTDWQDQLPAVPTPDDGNRDLQQLGKHCRRIESPHMFLILHQPKPMPEFCFCNCFHPALTNSDFDDRTKQVRRIGRWPYFRPDDHHVDLP